MNSNVKLLLTVVFISFIQEGNFLFESKRYGFKDDDYYEEFYLRRIPKLKVSPAKVKEFFANHLSWFPMDDLQGRDGRKDFSPSLTRIPRTDTTTPQEHSAKQKTGGIIGSVKNMTSGIFKSNFTSIKNESVKVAEPVMNYVGKIHWKDKIKNMTHPFRPRVNCSHTTVLKYMTTTTTTHKPSTGPYDIKHTTCGCRIYGPTVRVYGKSASRKGRLTFPRHVKVRMYAEPDKRRKLARHAKPPSNGTASNNASHVLETAEEMATDLAGRVTNLWKCVVGSRRSPQIKDIKYYLYTRRNIIEPEELRVNYELIKNKSSSTEKDSVECAELKPGDIDDFQRVSDDNREIIKSNFLSLRAPTKILIHGYTGSYKDTRMAKIKDAYLSTGRYNIIQVDWEVLAAPPCYIRVTHHSRFVGEIVARFIDGLYLIGLNMSLVHVVGFSLGAQVAGLAGNMVTLVKICRITGLDPALPLFLHTDSSGHLDKYDADFVDVIHTCGGILAMLDPVGHVDFYPNGGSRQPGCEFSNLKCSHSRAPQYFAESVSSNKKFVGQMCSSWEDYLSGECNNSEITAFMGASTGNIIWRLNQKNLSQAEVRIVLHPLSEGKKDCNFRKQNGESFSKSDPNVEDTEKNPVKIPSSELFNFVVECDKFNVDKIFNIGQDKVNKLSVQRQPIVVGNSYAFTRDLERKKEEFLIDEKLKLKYGYRGPFTEESLKSDFPSMSSNDAFDRYDVPNSKEKLTLSHEIYLDGELSSDASEGQKGGENDTGIVKSILGPSFEDAVLRTLEFGKSLIQKSELSEDETGATGTERNREKKEERKSKPYEKGCGEGDIVNKKSYRRDVKEQRASRRRIATPPNNNKEIMEKKKIAEWSQSRPLNLAKIRSLDSELKQVAQSPEKIKRQLEALIQINKDEPQVCVNTWGYFYPKEFSSLKPHLEYTVMPSTVRHTSYPISKEEGCYCGSKCNGIENCSEGSKIVKVKGTDGGESTVSKVKSNSVEERSTRSSPGTRVRQAPEYLANALGPTLDVSIMDNLKLMRNLFKCDKSEQDGRGEPQPSTIDLMGSERNRIENENETTDGRTVDDLQKRVDELTVKQKKLEKEIEEEECMREAKRKEFEEEERKMMSVKACLMEMAEEERVRESHKRQSMAECCDYEQKFEALKSRIKSEENRLKSLKDLSDCHEMEINEAMQQKKNLKRNKSLLDAWDVIASKACHTKLPSFSKVKCLERKFLKPKDNQHCCFPQKSDESLNNEDTKDFQKGCKSSRSRSLDSRSIKQNKGDGEDIPYPLQRDIICGLHRTVKTCLCNETFSKDNNSWSSDDEFQIGTDKERIPSSQLHRSQSETGRKGPSAKLCKVLWAVTRINIFQDNSRTYEIMDATSVPPKYPPVKTEGVFVVKNPKKCCPDPMKKVS